MNCKNYLSQHLSSVMLIIFLTGMVFMSLPMRPAEAQWNRQQQGTPLQEATKITDEYIERIIKEHVMVAVELSRNDLAKISEFIDSVRQKYYNSFLPEDKAKINIIEAFKSHFENDRAGVQEALASIEKLDRLTKFMKDNDNLSDNYILLALCWGEYDKAREQLQARSSGEAALENAAQSLKDSLVMPETTVASAANSYTPNTGRNQTTSDWRTLNDNPTNSTPQDTSTNQTTITSSSRKRNQTDRGPTMGVGMGLGGMAPVDPTYLQNQGSSSSSNRSSRQSYGYGSSRSNQSLLSLPVEYMPSSPVGQHIKNLNLVDLNNNVFQYSGNSGQALCALMWTIPTGNESRGGSSYRGRSSYGSVNQYGQNNAEKMPGLQPEDLMFEAAFDVNTSFSQFAKLFAFYQMQGLMMGTSDKIAFVGINFNPVNQKTQGQLAELVVEHPMPWPTCLYYYEKNMAQLNPKKSGIYAASPVMLMTDPEGYVCYAGPVGGVLPRMILHRQLEKAGSSGGMMSESDKSGFLGRLLGIDGPGQTGSKSDGGGRPSQQSNITTQPETAQQENGSTGGYVTLSPAEEMDADNKLEKASKLWKFNRTAALDLCDMILRKYPNTLQADKARQLIKDILKNNKALKQNRERAGKYTGEQ